jgi:uncharacterized membrane protein YhaH (DUF805 family)
LSSSFCSVVICWSSFAFFFVILSCGVLLCFLLFLHRHKMEASLQRALIDVVPVVLLGLGSIVDQMFVAIRPWRKLSQPIWCCCCVLGCLNGGRLVFVSPPSSVIALVVMAAHFGPEELHFCVSFVVTLLMALIRQFFGVSWLQEKTCAVSLWLPQNGQLPGSP